MFHQCFWIGNSMGTRRCLRNEQMFKKILHGWKETMGHITTKQCLPQLQPPLIDTYATIQTASHSRQWVHRSKQSTFIPFWNLWMSQVKYVPWSLKHLCAKIHPLFTTVLRAMYSFQVNSLPKFLFQVNFKNFDWTEESFASWLDLDCWFEWCKRTILLACVKDFSED